MRLSDFPVPRNRSKFGLHWTPVCGHAHADLTYYIDRAAKMGIGWVTLIDDGGGSTLEQNPFYGGKSVVDMFLERDIIPVIRFYAAPWASFDARMEDTARRLVERGVRYIFWMNEPECDGEWREHKGGKDPNWVYNCTRLFVDGAYKLIEIGAYPGWWATTTFRWTTPYSNQRVNPFISYINPKEREAIFVNGGGWIPIHNYAKNHPVDYPYDPVNQLGKPLTAEEYWAKIREVDEGYRMRTGDTWVWEDWETSEYHINLLREKGKNPGHTIEDDDTCFLMYQGMNKLLQEAGLLDYVPLIATECGPCVGERDDGRYPRVTPQEQIRVIEAELEEASRAPNFFGMCFWLAGVQLLHATTADGFEDQGWWTPRHNEPFKLKNELPIVQYMIDRRTAVSRSKLCPHVQYLDSQTLEAIRRVKPCMVKIMNADREQLKAIRTASPNSLIVARMYEANQDYMTDPAAAGRAFADRYADIVDLIDVAEVFNEAINNLADTEQCRKFDDYQFAFARRLFELWPDIKAGLFCLPTGNFGWPGEPALTPEWFPHTFSLPPSRCFICVHEYTWHDLRWEFEARMCRYRRQMQWAAAQGFRLLITECGFTQAVLVNKPDIGWRSDPVVWPREKYVRALRDYDAELQKDDYVVGAAIFTCGRNSGWDTFESLAEWEEAVSTSQLPPSQPDDNGEEEETMPAPQLEWLIPEWNDAEAEVIYATPGQAVWRLTRAELAPDNMANTVWVNVFDENGNRVNVAVKVRNVNGTVETLPFKPGEPYNRPMWKQDRLAVWIDDGPSDMVENLHGAYWNIPNVNTFHVGYVLTFQRATEPAHEEPPEPPPVEVTTQDIRNAAWNRAYPSGGMALNPEAAFQATAREWRLGCPVTNEFDIGPYRAQGFALGIVYARIGDWQNIEWLDW